MPLRVVIAAAVTLSAVALIAQDIVRTSVATGVLILIPAGFVVSWYRRHDRNIALKFALAGAAILALASFLRQLSGAFNVEAARAPLAEIFLWIQAIHSFDLPRRRDLHFSLAASVTLIALAGSLSFDTAFIVYFIPWGVLALRALYVSHLRDVLDMGRVVAAPVERAGFRIPNFRNLVATLVVIALAGGVAFSFAPRLGGAKITSLAFQLPRFIPIPKGAGIVNPGVRQDASGGGTQVAPNSYFGFANHVDLRVRARLSEDLVMRVRASQPASWRGAVFDIYSNSSWTNSASTKQPFVVRGMPQHIPPERGGRDTRNTAELIQTFYILSPQPNIVFAAYHPSEVWFPVGELNVDPHNGLSAPTLLETDTVYSVISDIPILDRDALAAEPSSIPPQIVAAYTQLPKELPPRVRHLANQLTSKEPTIVGKALAVEKWLADNVKYQIDIPAQPAGTDAVDHFIFEERRGFCEQIATSMAVMLRAAGIPSRLVTGFAAGRRNVLSGYFEVKQSDAHAWVEVFVPRVGWVEFDPTFGVEPVDVTKQRIPGIRFIANALKAVRQALPDGAVRAVGNFFKNAVGGVATSGPLLALFLAMAGAIVGSMTFLRPRIKRWYALRKLRESIKGPPASVLIGAFGILQEAAGRAGLPRAPSLTPSEFASRLLSAAPWIQANDVELVVRPLVEDVYGGQPAAPAQAAAALEAAQRVDALIASRG